jgi:hypothetical protein
VSEGTNRLLKPPELAATRAPRSPVSGRAAGGRHTAKRAAASLAKHLRSMV